LAGLVAFCGVALAVPPFLPWIEVSTDATLDPGDPFATPFIVHNASFLPIYSVRVLCHFNRIVTDPKHTGNQWDVSGIRAVRTPFIEVIEAQSRITSECWFPLAFREAKARLIEGDIGIIVEFRPSFYPWRQTRGARFVMRKDSAGQERWFPAPPKPKRPEEP